MHTKIATLCAATVLILVACFAAACGGSADPTQPAPTTPPAGATAPAPTATSGINGETLLNARCVACHPLDRVTQVRYTLVQWESTVKRMRANGASLTDAEAQVLVQYLAQTYGK
jgi:hypothetical protein